MPSHFRSLLSSKPFEIKSSEKSYFIHSDILSTQLEPSSTDIGETDGKIDLSDWDSDTVGLFAEFLYTGDYILESASDEDEESGRWNKSGTPDIVQSLPDQDMNVLLVHAKVYALAQHKSIEPLRVMAFERLKKVLDGIDGHKLGGMSMVTTGIIELLEYVYSHANTHAEPHEDSDTDSNESPEDQMRDLVSKFAAENVEKLMDRGEVATLLRGGGDFAVELMDRVGGRLCDANAEKQKLETAIADRIRELEAANEEKKKLETSTTAERIRELEVVNAEKQKLETTVTEKTRELEAVNAEKKKLETTVTEKTRELEAANEEKKKLGTTVTEKTRELEAANAEKQKLETTVTEKTRELEAANEEKKKLETTVAEKTRELEAVNAEKKQLLEKLQAANPADTAAPPETTNPPAA